MDQRSFQRLLRRTVAIPVILLMLMVALLAGEMLLLRISLRRVDHSSQVIANTRQLMRYMVEMEGAERAYYLTGDRSFPDSYREARSKIPDVEMVLDKMTADNPEQQQRLMEIYDLNSQWMSWADARLARGPNAASAAELLMGQRLMAQIREKQRRFTSVEEDLRRARSRRVAWLNGIMVGSAIGLSLLVAGLIFTLTRRELRQLSSTYEQHLQAEAEKAQEAAEKAQEAKESRELFQITLRSLGEAAIATDASGLISLINPAAQQLTGWAEEDAIGRPLGEVLRLLDERSRVELDDAVAGIRASRQTIGMSDQVLLIGRGNEEYPIELSGAPILNDAGKLVGVVVVFRDITQRRMTEQTLRSSERLTLAGRLSATIAHEIRNPLDTVTNLVYLLQHEPNQTPAMAQYLGIANDELARITQITSQLLTFHRESRSPVAVDLVEVIESVLTLFAPQIRKNHTEVEQRFESGLSVRGYPGELRQVFSNLVGNAIDAMPKGGRLMLHVRRSSLLSDPGCKGVRVTIIDNGVGIPAGVRKNLFAPFYTTKGEKGTGLGLWVSRGIIEKHEGTIHLTSVLRPGRSGTAFSVFLPFEQRLGMLEVAQTPPAA